MKLKIVALFIFALLLWNSALLAQEENITITTYYPSPYGVYSIMRLYPKNTHPDDRCSDQGEMYYYDGRGGFPTRPIGIYVCNGANWVGIGGGAPTLWDITPSNPNNIYNTNSGNVGIGTDNPTAAKLAVIGGNVGIGTTSPVRPLHIKGTAPVEIKLEDAGTGGHLDLTYRVDAGPIHRMGFTDGNAPGNWLFRVNYPDGTTWLAPGGGNVGIGTDNPLSKLSINSAGNEESVVYIEGNGRANRGITVEGLGLGLSIDNNLGINVLGRLGPGIVAQTNATNDFAGVFVGGINVRKPTAETGSRAVVVDGPTYLAAGAAEKRYHALEVDGSQSPVGAIGARGLSSFNGNVTVTGNLEVTGRLTKGSGSFVQPHPFDPTKEINYAMFEGREHRVFFDGVAQLKNGETIINVPEDFKMVASKQIPLNVILTPFGENFLFVKERSLERIVVNSKEKKDTEFGYLVIATRGGFEQSYPIQENTSFRPDKDRRIDDFANRFEIKEIKDNNPYSIALVKLNRNLLISNGILTKEGKANLKLIKKLNWEYKYKGFSETSQTSK